MLHKAHLTTLIEKNVPSIYIPQIQGSMWVTGRKSWWFMAYHPDHEPFICEVKRDDDYINLLSKFVIKFQSEMMQKLQKLKEDY